MVILSEYLKWAATSRPVFSSVKYHNATATVTLLHIQLLVIFLKHIHQGSCPVCPTGWGDAVRVTGVLAAVILFTLFVLGVLLHVLDDDLLYTLPLLILGLLSGR